jgi:Fic family protein
LTYDGAAVASDLALARLAQGKLLGKSAALGQFDLLPAEQVVWTEEAMATAAIEGEVLDADAVRSSIARRLGLNAATAPVARNVEGLLDVMDDAARRWEGPLECERLCRWQAALFPAGQSGLRVIGVGRYRDSPEPMQIVSGPTGRETVHFEAVPSADVAAEMRVFLEWFNRTRNPPSHDGLVRAALAHLWFETIHPFEDGNGRVGRALIDLALAQDVRMAWRLHGMSRQLQREQGAYYDALNQAQRGAVDVTSWVLWFLQAFARACAHSLSLVDEAIERGRFWSEHRDVVLSEHQRKALNKMLEVGPRRFVGGMTARKLVGLTGVSGATATRELADLVAKGMLVQLGGGRSTRYELPMPGWQWKPAAKIVRKRVE